jgi:hypothetical protein
MADNVILNPGVGGATVRTLADVDGNEYQVVAASYVTTLSPGANVLQLVDASHGLPVAVVGTPSVEIAADQAIEVTQDDASALKATVSLAPSQTLAALTSITNAVEIVQDTASALKATVDISAGQTIAATQSGSWSVGITGTPTVTATQSGTWTVGIAESQTIAVTQSGDWTFDLDAVEVTQDTAEDLLATAYQGGTWTVGLSASQTLAAVTSITNPVTVAQSTAANLKATVDISSGQTVGATQSGTWTVGLSASQTLAQVTTVGSVANPVGLKAGTALIGKASTGLDTSTIYDGTTALTPKFAPIDVSSSGNNEVVAAVTGKKIRVLRWGLTSNGTVSAKWRSGSTDLTGPRPLIQYASAGGSFCPLGLFETASGEALNLNLSGTVAVGGEILYAEV